MGLARHGAPRHRTEIVVLTRMQVGRQGTGIENPRTTLEASGSHKVQVGRRADLLLWLMTELILENW